VASDYKAICYKNLERYGTDIGRIGKMLLEERYDDRTHFIFELLQNAEDALGQRGGDWRGSREVTFELSPDKLVLSHFGKPFDNDDVLGVCNIGNSRKEKDNLSIGRFGIGFKSVYAFTARPEIHSGDEDFAIETYVYPKPIEKTPLATDETQIVLPLKPNDDTAQKEITVGFRRLRVLVLLFLRHISTINWEVQGGAAGAYRRNDPETLGSNVQRITVIGKETGKPDSNWKFLVFHRDVFSDTQENSGRVEIAFALKEDRPGCWSVQPAPKSPLVVFFPTAVDTHLDFLVQGPYSTTITRDNLPRDDTWNKSLIRETGKLLVEAMRWMRDNAMLDISALRCLPLDRKKLGVTEEKMFMPTFVEPIKEQMFTPIFDVVRQAFLDEPLLPCFGGGFVAARQAKLAKKEELELRELFSPEQVTELLRTPVSAWLTSDIASDREIRPYLIGELKIKEVKLADLLPRLHKHFLEAQPDDWVQRLYEFLSDQRPFMPFLRNNKIPLIRLDDGTHVIAHENSKANAFLPSNIDTGFPTIRRTVCATDKACDFLRLLGITEPDPVDDVVWNVLPKYRQDRINVDDEAYAADIKRIRSASSTDSRQRDMLLSELRKTFFVRTVNTGDGKGYFSQPGAIYIPTERLKQLFAGVSGVFIVDDTYDCLQSEEMNKLLEACGALRYPRPVKEEQYMLIRDDLHKLLWEAGHEETPDIEDNNRISDDYKLQGFDALIDLLPKLTLELRAERTRLIWESLVDLVEEYPKHDIFNCTCNSRLSPLPTAFLRHLNKAAWVPDTAEELVPPGLVEFDTLGWKPNSFLLTKIAFKPPIIDQSDQEGDDLGNL